MHVSLFCKNGIVSYMVSCILLFLFNNTSRKSYQTNKKLWFIFDSTQYSITWIFHNLFNHSQLVDIHFVILQM